MGGIARLQTRAVKGERRMCAASMNLKYTANEITGIDIGTAISTIIWISIVS